MKFKKTKSLTLATFILSSLFSPSVFAATGEVQFSIAPQYQIGASNDYTNSALNHYVPNVFDSSFFTYLDSNNASTGYTGLDLLVPAKVTRFRAAPRLGEAWRMAGMKLQGTNTSSSTGPWTDIYTITTPVSKHYSERQFNEFSVDTSGAFYRYYRLLSGSTTNYNISELRLLGVASSTTPYQPVAPTITPGGGRFTYSTNVRISSLTTDATNYYTTDGTDPSVISGVAQGTTQQYTAPFAVSGAGTTTVKAIAVLGGTNVSDISTSALFNIDRSFKPGQDWFDTNGRLIESHIGEVKYFNGKYYWYGTTFNVAPSENTSPGTSNSIGVVTTYSSPDLVNWTDEGQAYYIRGVRLERPHIIYNATTSQYVLWAHNTQSAANSRGIIATASSPIGPFTTSTTTLNPDNGFGLNDMNLFQDTDGSGYIVYMDKNNKTILSKLSNDYLSLTGATTSPLLTATKSAPALFKRGSTYFLMASSAISGWGTTAPVYATTTNIMGAWSSAVNPFQVSGSEDYTIGYRSQPTNVLQIPGRTDGYVYMGDRYDNSNVTANATTTSSLYNSRHVWLPVTFPTSGSMSISYSSGWTLDGAFVSASAPSAASGFSVTKVSTTASASWTNTESNAFSLFLDRATDSGFSTGLVSEALASTTTSFVDTTVVGGLTYYYRVRTVNASGSTNSATQIFSLTADIVSPLVTLTTPLTGATLSGTSTTLTATSSDDVGIASVQFYIDATSTGAVGTSSPYSITWDSTSVSNGAHTISAVAKDAAGNAATSTISVTAGNFSAPGIPTIVVAVAGDTQATVNWSAPASNGGSVITSYKVYNAANGVVATTTASTTFSAVVTGLTNNTSYTYYVTATNATGESASSTVSNSVTPSTVPTAPSSPQSLAVSASSTTSLSLTWSAPSSNGNSALTDYFIQYKVTGAGSYTTWAHAATTTTGTIITGLTANTGYTLAVSAVNAIGTSTASTVVGSTTAPAVPATVTVQAASSVGATTATLNGTITSTGNASPTIEGFNYGTTTAYGKTASTTGSFSTGSFSQSISGLVCNMTYNYQAYAVNTAGTGTSTNQTFTTSACPVASISASPTTLVQNSTANSVTLTGVNTTWTAGTPGSPTFTISGGTGATIDAQVVNSTSSATLTISAGSSTGTLILTDPSTSATTSITVSGAASAPTLTTSSSTSITQTTATLNGNITATGSATPVMRGFQYGASTSYGATTTEVGTFGTGAFTASLTNLSCGGTYFVRSYASSTAGISYGSSKTFTMLACGTANATGEIQFSVKDPYGYGISGDNGYLNQGRKYPNAYDGDFSTYWDSNQTVPWFALDLTTNARVTRMRFAPALGSTQRMVGSMLQAATSSASNGPWTTLYTVPTGYYPQRQFTEVSIDTAGQSYKYYRFITPSGLGGNVAEFRLIGQPGQATPYQPVAPVINPQGGRYPTAQRVRITSLTTNASIYYTTDGTTPTFSSGAPQGTAQLYTAPISITATTTVKAIAVSEGQYVSDVSDTAQFYIGTSYVPGSDWYDTTGKLIESHSGEVRYFNGKYYWYGQIQNTYMPEWERVGVSVYSSTDLVNWKDVGPALYLAASSTIVERPHVIYNSSTNKYVLWGHNWVGGTGPNSMALVAQSDTPEGPFVIASSTYNPNGYGLNDMTLFQDDDGTGYVIYSSASDSNGQFFISKLSSDYLTTQSGQFVNPPTMSGAINKREAPAMIKRNGVYFLLTSGVTGWAANENKYSTSSSPLGTWSALVNEFQPSGVEDYLLAYRSQGTNVLKIAGRNDGYIYMGDRFDASLNSGLSNTNAGAILLYGTRHVWLPITFTSNNTISISYTPSWNLDDAFTTASGPAAATSISSNRSGLTGTVSWTNSETNGYTLYVDRATDSIFSQNLISDLLVSTATSYSDPYLSYGNAYYYRLRTVTGGGTTFSSTTVINTGAAPDVTVPTIALTVPLSGATLSGTSTTLTATSSDNVSVSSVQFYVDATSTGATGTSSPYSITWDSTSVSNGAHTISAVAADSSGNVATSTVSVTVANFFAPSAPTIGAVTPGDSQVVVNWSAPASNGGSVLTSYKIYNAANGTLAATTATTTLSRSITGLTNGTPYSFYVTATNAIGESASSSISSSATPTSTPTNPSSPQSLAISTNSTSSLSVTWSAPASNGNSALVDYLIQYKVTGGGSYTTWAHSPTTTTGTTITGLATSTSYTIAVSAVNGVGTSTASTVIGSTLGIIDNTPPTITVTGAPTSPEYSSLFTYNYATASDIGSGIASYQWSKVSGLGTVTFGSPTSLITTVSASNNDNYVIRLTVTDVSGNLATTDFAFLWVPATGLAITAISPVGTNVATDAATSTITFNKNITLLDGSKVSIVDNLTNAVKSSNIAVSGGNGSSTILNIPYGTLENDKDYRMIILQNAVRDDQGNTNTQAVYYFHTQASGSAALAVTGIDAQKTSATADGTYASGWRWLLHITVPTSENSLNLKFDNWTSGSNSILAANNMRFYSAQSANAASSLNAISITAPLTYAGTALILNSDLDSGRAGRQVDVTVEMALPVGTPAGSYSTSYGINSN